MNQLTAFIKKEFTELKRTGKLLIMLCFFILLGIMNPAIAKLTPWLFELLSDSMAKQGIIVGTLEVTALTSWIQYYKTTSIELIFLIIMFSGILVNEYQKGTLINMLTKGLARWKVLLSKALAMVFTWTLCYWLCFGITYLYNAYFWDNSIVVHLLLSAFCIYLVGIWLISILIAASAIFSTSSAVLLITSGTFATIYFLSIIPTMSKFLPTKLLSAQKLITGIALTSDFNFGIIITLISTIFLIGLGIWRFNVRTL
jgi:ABC-2 type transport system permease protein